MKSQMLRRSILAISTSALIFAVSACNPNRNNPNYNASQSQPGTTSSPGMSGNTSGNTGSISGAGDASNTGSTNSSGGSSGTSSGSR